jgi:phosphoglycolate phosphatase-like HAD superfamily hydrolase
LAQQYWTLYEDMVKQCPLNAGAIETPAALPCKHIILSASPQPALEAQVAQFPELARYIHRIMGTDNTLGASKTELAQQLRDEQLCRPDEMAVVGDTDHDAATAAVLGCPFIAYAGGHQHNHGMTELSDLLYKF